jgi:predicted negative regulator of RcsB-dependent stress response
MNWGILTLMVVVYGVLMGIAGFFGYIIYRSHRLSLAVEAQESAQETSESSADTTH